MVRESGGWICYIAGVCIRIGVLRLKDKGKDFFSICLIA